MELYTTTQDFPPDERFGLTSQIRRACVSIGANLAEGCCRRSNREFARFVEVALGSASEVEYLLLLARDLGHLHKTCYGSLVERLREVKRMLTRLRQRHIADSSSRRLMAAG